MTTKSSLKFINDNLHFFDTNQKLININKYLEIYDINVLLYIKKIIQSKKYPEVINDWLILNQIYMINSRKIITTNNNNILIIIKKSLNFIFFGKITTKLINRFNLTYSIHISLLK